MEKGRGERTIDLKPRIRIPHDALTRPSQCFFASLLCSSAVDLCRADPDIDMCKAQFLVLALRNERRLAAHLKKAGRERGR